MGAKIRPARLPGTSPLVWSHSVDSQEVAASVRTACHPVQPLRFDSLIPAFFLGELQFLVFSIFRSSQVNGLIPLSLKRREACVEVEPELPV